jgi:hypothetical protein
MNNIDNLSPGATVGLCDLQLSLFFSQTPPVLKTFSSEPDGMPLIEAWWQKNNRKHLTSALKVSVSVSI